MDLGAQEGPHRSQRGQRGEAEGHQAGQDGADRYRAECADQVVAEGHGWAGPEGPHDVEVGSSEADPAADHLPRGEEGGDAGDSAEDRERDGLGPQGVVGDCDAILDLDVDEGETLGQHAFDLIFDHGEISVAVLQRQPGQHRVTAAGEQLVRQRRREQHDGLALCLVLVLEQVGRLRPCDADQLDPRPLVGRDG